MDATEAGALIREWRKEKGWSQTGLAEAAGLSPSQIQNIEAGRRRGDEHPLNPSASTVRQLANGFGMPYGIRILEMYGYPEQVEDFKRSQLVAVSAGVDGLDDLEPAARKLIQDLISLLKSDKPGYHTPAQVIPLSRRSMNLPTHAVGRALA